VSALKIKSAFRRGKVTQLSTDWGSFDRNSLDRNCVFSVDQHFDNQLTEFLDAFQLIETFNNDFGLTPKN
jgi:hypothetical protein